MTYISTLSYVSIVFPVITRQQFKILQNPFNRRNLKFYPARKSLIFDLKILFFKREREKKPAQLRFTAYWNKKKKKGSTITVEREERRQKRVASVCCRGTRPMTDHELGGNSSKIICFQSPGKGRGSERGDENEREERRNVNVETAAFPLASTTFPPPNWQEWRTTLVIARTKRRNRRMMCSFLLPSAFSILFSFSSRIVHCYRIIAHIWGGMHL